MKLPPFLLLLLLPLLSFKCCLGQSSDPVYRTCGTPVGGQASRNIEILLPRLVSGTIQNGYIATSEGTGGDRIYGLAQCRGDVDAETCSSCINDAARNASRQCANQADARVWYDFCFLRYSNVDFFGQVDTTGLYLYNVADVTDPDTFNRKLGALIRQVSSQAVKPASKGLGKGKTDLSPFIVLYALAQCTRDLSALSCAQCVSTAVSNFPTVCNNKRGCRVLYGSCYVRYELYPFYFPVDKQNSSFNSVKNYNLITA